MKAIFLFPNSWRSAGYIISLMAITFIVLSWITGLHLLVWPSEAKAATIGTNNSLDDEVQCLLLITGLVLIAFTKERVEDEHISQLRLDSLQWAVYINYTIFIICLFTLYNLDFLPVVIYNVFTPLIIFIVRFRYLMYKESKTVVELV